MAEEAPNTQETPAATPEAPAVAATPAPAPAKTAPPLPPGALFIWGTGRRKKAVARVRIRPGTGQFTVNKRERDKYFLSVRDRNTVMVPLETAGMVTAYDIFVNVNGGGPTGQAGAVSLGLSRALAKAAPDVEAALRDKSLMTRDARMKERKKYGQKGARKRFQFSKR